MQDLNIVVTIRPWNIKVFKERIQTFSGKWLLIDKHEDLNFANLQKLQPRYIFFPHWSEKVPLDILENFECVCFHETDVPYGRGGSPVQNLITAGHRSTKITALRMIEKFDAGPVYMKCDLSLEGLAEEIYIRSAEIVADMIYEIVRDKPSAVQQSGAPTVFKRRVPEESRIPSEITTLKLLFDHIRMLDAAGYPQAFIDYGPYRLVFSRPALRTNNIIADVSISLWEE